jgi:hypothetical protein
MTASEDFRVSADPACKTTGPVSATRFDSSVKEIRAYPFRVSRLRREAVLNSD